MWKTRGNLWFLKEMVSFLQRLQEGKIPVFRVSFPVLNFHDTTGFRHITGSGPRRNLAGNTHTLQHVVVLMGNVNFVGLKTSQLFLYVSFLVELHLA
jgi:hypothetical protein